jgi:predicted DNA-binding protein with PD1-like motif
MDAIIALYSLLKLFIMKIHALRLTPGEDLKKRLISLTESKGIVAGCILTCVGSLQQVCLRLADRNKTETYVEKFEIIALSGTLSQEGVHLHLGVADSSGKMIGGHLMDGNLIYTTAEIIIGELTDFVFERRLDERTTYKEIVISRREG